MAADRRARTAAAFLPNFALAKGVIYLVPLAIAAWAPPAIYAGVELANSLGLLVAGALAGPIVNGATQVYLVNGERRVFDQLSLVVLISCLAALLLAAGAQLAAADALTVLVIASFGVAVIHFVVSSAFRMLSWRNSTAWADGTAMILSGLIVLALLRAGEPPTLPELTIGFALLAGLGAALAALGLVRWRAPSLPGRLAATFAAGLPITVVGALAMWLAAGGRVAVGLTNASELAAYGVAFRVSGLALGIQQLVNTAMYAWLYTVRTRRADPLLAAFFFATLLLLLAIAASAPWLTDFVELSALDARGKESFRHILPLTALQVFYWIGYALLQIRVNRYRLAGRAIVPTAVVTLAGVAVILGIGLLVSNDIVLLSWLIALHGAALFFTNVAILARRGLPHRKVTLIGVGGGGALGLVALLIA